MTFALSVPANLLLLGEYAVTEEGGLGIALASAPRLRLHVAPRRERGLVIAGRMGPTSFEWIEGKSEPPPLVAACLDEARARLADQPSPRIAPSRIDIDSSAFFSSDGNKRGFGSSAAVAVGLSAALLRLGGLEGQALEAALFPTALAAHRSSQGGRGSGYDVAASRYGGAGLFIGGTKPEWTSLPVDSLAALRGLGLALRFGPRPVSSALAVGAYQRWKSLDPIAHRAFLGSSAALVRDFMAARTPESLITILDKAAAAGIAFGETIGVPARPLPSSTPPASHGAEIVPRPAPSPVEKCLGALSPVEKCLGAGDELILVAALESAHRADAEPENPREQGQTLPLRVESEGLRWE
ncbi:MAG TPA: hypothetical protein VMV83_15935 [Rectinemataceae bacterium]|nr:hypothetical protein [Rectinemataceae bacterium]